MKVNTEAPIKKYQFQKCERCEKLKQCTWHHIGHRRYMKEWVWLCISNLATGEEGCHEFIHSNPAQGYEEGFLIKHNIEYKFSMKQKKNKTHTHGKTYNRFVEGKMKIICSLCGQQIETPNFGSKKKENVESSKAPKIKMGFEIKDTRTIEGAKLNTNLSILKVKLKKISESSPDYIILKTQEKNIISRMHEIQKSYES